MLTMFKSINWSINGLIVSILHINELTLKTQMLTVSGGGEWSVCWIRKSKNVSDPLRPGLTWPCVHGLDLFSWLQVPETDVGIEGAGGSDGSVVTDVHWHHTQLVALQSPLQLQLLVWPAGTVRHGDYSVTSGQINSTDKTTWTRGL